MKKAGSSNSKSKTQRTSKNSPPSSAVQVLNIDNIAVGHNPAATLSPQDEELFKAFQSNLLSLISHELRTPLIGILNALGVLEENESNGEFSAQELIRMARRNAQRLNQTLASLLDLAAIESGNFHARMREVDLPKLALSRLEAQRSGLEDRDLKLTHKMESGNALLADPQKLGRAIDLCFEALISRAEPGSTVEFNVTPSMMSFIFQLNPDGGAKWDSTWSHAVAAYESGISSPYSAFSGVMQSEKAFLTRSEEGLGSEFILIHEIIKLHGGQFKAVRNGSKVNLQMELRELSSEQGLRAVLVSRAFRVSNELGSVALVLIQIPPEAQVANFKNDVKRTLFRASDAVYVLAEKRWLAIILDDCKAEDAPRMLNRVQKAIGQELHFGVAHCPTDGLDPAQLFEIAEKRLGVALQPWVKP